MGMLFQKGLHLFQQKMEVQSLLLFVISVLYLFQSFIHALHQSFKGLSEITLPVLGQGAERIKFLRHLEQTFFQVPRLFRRKMQRVVVVAAAYEKLIDLIAVGGNFRSPAAEKFPEDLFADLLRIIIKFVP